MKKITPLLFAFIFMHGLSFSQSGLTFDVTQLYTSFKFNDNAGLQHNEDYQGIYTGAYGIGFRSVNDIGIFIRGGLGMRSGGANLVYDEMNYSWKLQYADLKLGLGYMTTFQTVNPYFTASGYYGFLLRGIQTLHNENKNITKAGILNNVDYGVIFSPGLNVKLSDNVSGYFELSYLKGLANIEKDHAQKSKNFAYGLSIGIAYSIAEK